MPNYVTYWVRLNEENEVTLFEAMRNNSTAELLFTNHDLASGDAPLIFLPSQIKKIQKANSIGTNVRLTFSRRHVQDLINHIVEWEIQYGGNLFGSLVALTKTAHVHTCVTHVLHLCKFGVFHPDLCNTCVAHVSSILPIRWCLLTHMYTCELNMCIYM